MIGVNPLGFTPTGASSGAGGGGNGGGAQVGAANVSDGGTAAAYWSVQVFVDGADVSADVVGKVVVEAEESAARIADLTLHQASGTEVEPALWVGRGVVIQLVSLAGGGMVDGGLLFSGIVDLPTVVPGSGTISLRCTDDRQGVIAAMDKDAIKALLPGAYFSPAVFDAGATAYTYANDLLSTLPVALDIAPTGGLRVTAWKPKDGADLDYSDNVVLDRSVSVDIAERSRLVNSIEIKFGYRVPLVKAEGYAVSYDPIAVAATSFGYWVRDGKTFMSREAIVQAIEKAGGAVVSITYTPLPTTAQVIPGTGGAEAGAWLPNPATDPQFCLAFYAVVAFDYAQQGDENHTITVSNAASIAAIGRIGDKMSGALEGVYDDTVAIEQNILLYRQKVTSIPPKNLAPVVVGLTNSVVGTLTSDSDRDAADLAMETLIAIAKTRIYSSHRAHVVSASVPAHADIDVDKTISVVAGGVSAKGKVKRVVHTLDLDGGSAISDFDLAICSVAGIGVTHPEDTTAAPAGAVFTSTAELGIPTVSWNSNATADQTITITFPGVEAVERAKAERTIESSFAAPLYEDILTVTL